MDNIANFNSVLLPKKGVDLQKWAVIACDQFTGDPGYWRAVEALVGDAPSTLRLTLPEIYLNMSLRAEQNEAPQSQPQKKPPLIESINSAMDKYLSDGVFDEYKDCAILTERRTPYNARRLGLVFSIDLEAYSYDPADKAAIRATEGTIKERIPPRVQIRRGAALETSHIMALVDDPGRTLIEPLHEQVTGIGYQVSGKGQSVIARSRGDEAIQNTNNKGNNSQLRPAQRPLYDFDLNMGGGHITGWLIKDTKFIAERLNALRKPDGFMLAVGDGNHSLASAKAYWDETKPALNAKQRASHPARFALIEAVNIYDEGLTFEPIHRIVYDTDASAFKQGLKQATGKVQDECTMYNVQCTNDSKMSLRGAQSATSQSRPQKNSTLGRGGGCDPCEVIRDTQQYIDAFLKERGGTVDYIHGEKGLADAVKRGAARNAIPVPMPAIKKEDFFPLLNKYGIFPRKAFSLGEGVEKRYYLEARRIK